MKPINKVAVIHDLCGIGKSALTNIIPILSVMGFEVCPIPTMLFSSHKNGFGTVVEVDNSKYIEECRKVYKENEVDFQVIFIGYLGSEEAVESAARFVNSYRGAQVIIDPTFADKGKCYLNFDLDYVESIKQLISVGSIITPNYTEACFLSGEEYKGLATEWKLKKICYNLEKIGAKDIIITNVPSEDISKVGLVICSDGELETIYFEKSKGNYPGISDIFASVLIGEIKKGSSIIESSKKAYEFVHYCIKESNKYRYPRKEGVLLEKCLYKLVN